jgi:hypothetical protein
MLAAGARLPLKGLVEDGRAQIGAPVGIDTLNRLERNVRAAGGTG